MEEVKRKAQTLLTPLRAQVLRLSQQCKARDELIRRLSHVLRRYEEDSDVIRAADTVVAAAAQDYGRPISPLTSNMMADLDVCLFVILFSFFFLQTLFFFKMTMDVPSHIAADV